MDRMHRPRSAARMRMVAVAAVAVGAGAALWPTARAAACTCGTLRDVPGSMEVADAVFLGRVTRLDMVAPTLAERAAGAQSGPDVALFRVQRVYKGDVAAVTPINFDYALAAQCGPVPNEGSRFVVFAYRTGPTQDWLDRLDDALREHLATPDGRRHEPSFGLAPDGDAFSPGTLASGGCSLYSHWWFMPYMRRFRALYSALGSGHAPLAPASATATAASAATAMATLGWSPEAIATKFASQAALPAHATAEPTATAGPTATPR